MVNCSTSGENKHQEVWVMTMLWCYDGHLPTVKQKDRWELVRWREHEAKEEKKEVLYHHQHTLTSLYIFTLTLQDFIARWIRNKRKKLCWSEDHRQHNSWPTGFLSCKLLTLLSRQMHENKLKLKMFKVTLHHIKHLKFPYLTFIFHL